MDTSQHVRHAVPWLHHPQLATRNSPPTARHPQLATHSSPPTTHHRQLAVSACSIAAGQLAVFKTVTTRSMFIPLFSLCGPPLIVKAVIATGAVAAGSGVAMALEVGAVAAMLAVGLPFALALQPLQMELDVTSLEPELQGLKKADGSAMTHVYASKGM